VHRVVEKERLVLVPPDEIEGEVLDEVGAVRAFREIEDLTVFIV